MANEAAHPGEKPRKKVDLAAAMVELGLDQIAEGRFRREIDSAIRSGHTELRKYIEDTLDTGGKVVITARIELSVPKDMDDHVEIATGVKKSVPVRKRSTLVKSKQGRMLCQPTGSTEDTPDQNTLFFAPNGTIIGRVNTTTGELVEDEDDSVVGAIGRDSA